ncbi:MAG: S8 family peptidase, partial [Bacillota bacterium]|nr:S8 family peptidase [Bacillota bacterium]
MANNDVLLNLFLNVPDEIRAKLIKFSQNEQIEKGKIELTVLYSTNADKVRKSVNDLGGTLEDLGFGFGIVTINVSNAEKLLTIPEIQYIELPKTLFTSYRPANDASCISAVWQVYGLTGAGILVGFVDSGIDYTHPAFIDENGNTRIEYICDYSEGGKVWSKKDINNAIKSPNPLSIVPETDEIGHGTHVAGIACAGGNIDKINYGAAYKSSIIMVKMTPKGKVNYAKSTQLMRGIKFLIDRAAELKMPLVINLSFSTNDGAHDGQSLLEQYISTISSLERISFVVAAGNEGDAAHHYGGDLKKQQDITVNVANETALILQLYKNLTDNISIQIKDPSGKSSEIQKIEEGYKSGSIGENKYFIYYSGPKPFSLNGEVIITFASSGEFLTSGPWTLTIYMDEGSGKHYDIWMPISEDLNKDTKFLQPNPYNTLGIPATASYVIAVGSYNNVTNTISSFSGRGRVNNIYTKPDITAPGENIQSSVPGGGFDVLSGTSMAAPITAGACALFMEWGLLKGNDPLMYGDRLRYYLLKGATRGRAGVTYPDAEWGYGTLCLRQSIEIAKNKGRLSTSEDDRGRLSINSQENKGQLSINNEGQLINVEDNKEESMKYSNNFRDYRKKNNNDKLKSSNCERINESNTEKPSENGQDKSNNNNSSEEGEGVP